MSKIIKGIIIIPIFLILSYFLYLFFENRYTKIIFIIVVGIYSLVLIPNAFHDLLSSLLPLPSKMKGFYHWIHVFFVVLPIGLIGQVILIDHIWWMMVITQIISICNLFILYKWCKHLIKKHLKYLRYSNMFITGIFTFLLSLLYSYKDSPESVFTFLFLLPLFGLQVLYEKIDISVKDEEEKTT